MKKLFIVINKNPFTVDTQWGEPVYFNKVKISNIIYVPQNDQDIVHLKIATSGKFDKILDTTNGRKYFYIQPIMKNTALGFLNISNCNDWDYEETDYKYLTDFKMTFYENDNLITDSYLADNPIYLEITFK